MKKPEISVIVPVYNVSKQLKRSLDSILCQTFSNIEIICVNDGSTDDSGKILEEYAKKDSRIKIVTKKNGGLSSARNAGVAAASGDFFAFVDSDDRIAPQMLEKLYDNMISLNTDISICAVERIDENTGKIDNSDPYYTLGYFDESFDGRAFSYKDTKAFLTDVCVMAWNKLYRRSFVEKCGASFPEGRIFEDGPFFFSLFFKTERVSIVREYLYFYYINRKGSIIEKGGKKFLDLIDVVGMMYEKIKNTPDFDEVKYNFFRKKVDDIIFRYEHIDWKYKTEFLRKLKTECPLADETLFPLPEMKGSKGYNYFLFSLLKQGSPIHYELSKFRMKFMYKIMEILYKDNDFYVFKYKKFLFKTKKNKNFADIYYCDDKIHVILMKKIKLKIPFYYSKLERFNDNE